MRCRHAALALALSLISLSAADPTTGLGVSLKEDSSMLLIPFQLTPSLRLEGLVNFTHRTGSRDSTSREIAIGAGLFHMRSLTDHSQLYAGARFSYSTSKASADGSDYLNYHGYSVNPLMGIEYKMSRHFSLAGEVGIHGHRYQMDGDQQSLRRHGTAWVSQNNLVLRAWF